MASMVDIKRRMKSIKGTQQMTKAMNLVASAKLGRAKQRLNSSRPFNEESYRMVSSILSGPEKIEHPFLTKKEGDTVFIVITADRGLCGGYNANAIKEVENIVAAEGLNWENVSLLTVGKKSTDRFSKSEKNILDFKLGISEKPTYADAVAIANSAISRFKSKKASRVILIFTYFESIISHVPTAKTLLPIDPSTFKGETSKDVIIYEPDKTALLDYLLPKHIATQVYDALVESAACEQGARMTSMDNATKNAKEALGNMTLLYNRARQAAITQEISEIVGGANAIQGG